MEKRQIRDALRSGDPVELEPNLYGRLNKQNKTLELSDGRVLRVPKDEYKDYFPEGSSDLRRIEQKEDIGSQIDRIPFGKALFQGGETSSVLGFAKDLAERYINQPVQSLQVKPGQEKLSYAERLGENYLANRGANLETSQDIDESNPYQSLAGKGLGLAADVALTRNMSATKAAPLLALGSQKTDVFDNPKEAAENAAIATALGYGTDKLVGGLSKVAGSRANRRAMRQNIADVEKANIAGHENMGIINKQRALANEAEMANVNAQNASTRTAYESQLAQREAELAALPQKQQAVNQLFGQNVERNLDKLERTIGKFNIPQESLGVDKFIVDQIETTALAGTKEANQAGRFLKSIFQGTEGELSAQQLRKGFKALEDRIASSTGEFRNILTNFKAFAEMELPQTLPNAIVYGKYGTKIRDNILRNLQSDLGNVFNRSKNVLADIQSGLGAKFEKEFADSISNGVNKAFQESSSQFTTEITNGNLRQNIANAIRNDPKYIALQEYVGEYKSFLGPYQKKHMGSVNIPHSPGYAEAEAALNDLPELIADRFTKQVEKYMPDIGLEATTKAGTSQRALQGIQGAPTIIPEPPPVTTPSYKQLPSKFQPQQFVETPVPSMPAPQGLAERLGESLENYSPGNLLRSKGALDNPIAKLAGLKYLFGKAAAPIEAAVIGGPMALKGLTSPSAGGAMARGAVRRGGAVGADALLTPNPQQLLQNLGTRTTTTLPTDVSQVIQNLKMKYPSYHDGIFETPEDRKSAVAEIEKNPYLSIEDKAVLQANINRGKPIE